MPPHDSTYDFNVNDGGLVASHYKRSIFIFKSIFNIFAPLLLG